MMQMRIWACCAVGTALILLTGCEPQPEDIETWKAEKDSAKLVEILNDDRQFMRLDTIAALEEIQAADAVDDLGKLLQDRDVVVVHRAIDALAAIGTPSIEKYMLQAITFDTDPARLAAAKALGELKSSAAVEPLAQALNDQYETVAVEAAVSLGRIGDARAVPALAETSKAGSVRLRGSCAASIRQIGGEAALEPLTALLGDDSMKVRNEAVNGLIELGTPAAPAALQALRSENNYVRQSGLAVLDGIQKVPTGGSDLVWYRLADLAAGEKPKIQREAGYALGGIDGAASALVDAASHPSYAIREHAYLGLETIGEPAAEPLLAAAAAGAEPAAQRWLDGRKTWAGAPAWQLDLWAAAAALNPAFKVDARQARLLKEDGESTEDLLRSQNFQPRREVIPLLIKQLASSDGEENKLVKTADTRRTLAFRKLRANKYPAKLPLLAALQDEDLEIAVHAAKILVTLDDDPAAQEAVIAEFAARIDRGEDLHGTPFYDALVELELPEADEQILKVRPNSTGAVYAFRKKYPGVQVSNMSMAEGKQHPTAEPFRLKYLADGKAREMRIIFRPNEDGNWVPDPPLPDELPDS